MRKAVENENDIYDGAAFESGTFCIEITSPLDRVPPAPDRPGTDPKVGEELRPAYACDIEEDEATFSMVYTEDLIRKQKRWHDGTVVYRKCDELVILCALVGSRG